MAQKIGETIAKNIVDENTEELISLADHIILKCKGGTNCNVSINTSNYIREELSSMANDFAKNFINKYAVSTYSVLSNIIYENYSNLASVVSAVYSFQCGAKIVNSYECVNTSSSVINIKEKLTIILTEPVVDVTKNLTISSILLGLSVAFIILFVVLFLIGFIMMTFSQNSNKTPYKNTDNKISYQNTDNKSSYQNTNYKSSYQNTNYKSSYQNTDNKSSYQNIAMPINSI